MMQNGNANISVSHLYLLFTSLISFKCDMIFDIIASYCDIIGTLLITFVNIFMMGKLSNEDRIRGLYKPRTGHTGRIGRTVQCKNHAPAILADRCESTVVSAI